MASNDMTMRFGVDDGDFRAGIARMKSSIQGLTNEWKENERAYKQVGDAQNAQKVKVEGLNNTLKRQQAYLKELKDAEKQLGSRTKENASQYDFLQKTMGKLQADISKTNAAFKGQERVLQTLTKQTNEQRIANERLRKEEREIASTYKHRDAELQGLNRSLKTNDEITKSNSSQLNRLKQTQSAMTNEYNGLTTSIKKQQDIRKIELERLGRLKNMTNASGFAIEEQKLKVVQATEKLGLYNERLKLVNSQMMKSNPFGNGKWASGFNEMYRASEKLGKHMDNTFRNIKSGAINASIGVGIAGAAALKGAEKAGEIEKTYIENNNLMVTGGEKVAEVTKHVAQMQADGRKYSLEYGVSQKEIADGYQELIKRGYSGSQSVAAMGDVIKASVATGDEFSEVMKNATQTLEGFGMMTDDTAQLTKNTKEVVNQMAMAADATATDFHSLGLAMEYSAQTASGAGISLSETSAAIGILSNNGLEAEKAGTGLRKVINSLTAPTDAAAGVLSDLGISTQDFIDKAGNLKPINEIMGMLNKQTKDLGGYEKGQIFHTLFGTTGQEAGRILTNNAEHLGELTEKVKGAADGQGYVTELANKNMAAVQNQVKQFKAMVDELGIQIGTAMLPVISKATKAMVEMFASKEGQEGLKKLAEGVAAVADGIVGTITFIGDHTEAVKVFAKAFAGIWALNKIGKTLTMLREMKTVMAEMAAINAMGNITGAAGAVGGGKGGKAGAAAGATAAGAVATGGSGVAQGAGKALSKSSAMSVFKGLGKTLGPLAILTAFPELFSGTTGEKIGGFTGSLAGAGAGAAAGAAVGSVVPGIGTAVGAVGGAVAGGIGSSIGGKAGRKVGGDIDKSLSKQAKENDKQRKAIEETNRKIANSYRVMDGDILVSNKQVFESTEKNRAKLQQNIGKVNKEMRAYDNQYKKTSKKLNEALSISVSTDDKKNKKASQQVKKALQDLNKNEEDHLQNKQKRQKKNFDIITKNTKMEGKALEEYKDSLKNRQKEDKKDTDNRQKIIGKMAENEDKYQEKIQEIKDGGSKELQRIAKKYGKSDLKYQAQLHKELNKAQEEYVENQTKLEEELGEKVSNETQIAAGKQKDILADLKNKKGDMTVEAMQEAIKNSAEERDVIINDAEKTYKGVVDAAQKKFEETTAAADEEYYVNKTISKDKYDEIIKNATKEKDDVTSKAKEQKDETVKQANETHDGVVKAAQEQADEHNVILDKETGDALTGWDNFVGGLAHIVNWFTGGINHVLKFFGAGEIGEWKPKGYATGTKGLMADETALVGEEGFELAYHPQKGIHALGVNGPEITNLKAGTSILPHNMSKQFLAMAQQIPAHKDGVMGTIHNMWDNTKNFVGGIAGGIGNTIGGGIDWIVDKARDVWDFIDKGAKSVVDTAWNSVGGNNIQQLSGYGGDMFKSGQDSIIDNSIKGLQKIFDKKEEEEKKNSPSGEGVQRWRGQVVQALKANGLATDSEIVNRVLRQIATESGGNERAVQGDIGDINNITGDLAKGLMQTISTTFNAYAHPGHGNIFNGYDNLLAALNYAKTRYGDRLSYLGNGHGYEHGGIITSHQIAELGENGKREAVIPLDISERARAIPLLKTAVNEVAGHTASKPSGVDVTTPTETDLTEILAKLDAVTSGLSDIVMAVNTALTPQRVTKAVNTQTQLNSNLQSQMRGI